MMKKLLIRARVKIQKYFYSSNFGLELLGYIDDIDFQVYFRSLKNAICVFASAVSIFCEFLFIECSHSFQTAGIGVFAGRAFKKEEIVLQSSMLIFVPRNFRALQALRHYTFGHNETHMA